MNNIKDILHYILNEYPNSRDLTKTRLTKLFYLIDWEYTKKYQEQITDIGWYYDHYGPYVSDVLDVADDDKEVKIDETISAFGGVKYVIKPKEDKVLEYNLTPNTIEIIDQVIENTSELSWNDFIKNVYETAPIKNSYNYVFFNFSKFI